MDSVGRGAAPCRRYARKLGEQEINISCSRKKTKQKRVTKNKSALMRGGNNIRETGNKTAKTGEKSPLQAIIDGLVFSKQNMFESFGVPYVVTLNCSFYSNGHPVHPYEMLPSCQEREVRSPWWQAGATEKTDSKTRTTKITKYEVWFLQKKQEPR